jgi:hypothetical protein
VRKEGRRKVRTEDADGEKGAKVRKDGRGGRKEVGEGRKVRKEGR